MATPKTLFDSQEETWKEMFENIRKHESLNYYLAQGATDTGVDIFGTDWSSNDAIKTKLEMMCNVTFDHMVNTISDTNIN